MNKQQLKKEAIHLLKDLIAIQSFSGSENDVAQLVYDYLLNKNIQMKRKLNNVWAVNKYFNSGRPTILLNSHLDTVKPNSEWSLDPLEPVTKDGKLYGLGSNDAGGALVSLVACFLYFNLILSATAEEENSGKNGITAILNDLGEIDLAIVGEPTQMNMAVAEKGLMVLDCYAEGKSAHVAHNVGENAIVKAINDINWFHTFKFPEESQFLGPVKMSVTMIKAGIQHNIIPEICKFTVDIRSTDRYGNQEVLDIIKKHISSRIEPRSIRLNPSAISMDHFIVKAATDLSIKAYGSPTTSDQAVIPVDSVKIGPGDSIRSHTADEYIEIGEIENGIDLYIKLLERYGRLVKRRTH
jgi:acetylornithine deacetylase